MTLAERFEKLEPRERRLLTGLIIAVGAIFVVFLPAKLYQMVSSQRDENQAIVDFLATVSERRAKIEKQKATREQLQTRYQKTMPALATFVEDAAKTAGVEIEESGPKPDAPHGKKYVEHILFVRLRKVGLLGLVKMLEKIEKSNYPVAITRLNIKPHPGEADSFDVEAFVSQFESKDVKKAAPPPKDADEPEGEDTP